MKERFLLVFGLSMTILSTGLLPALAQSRRYPTDAEVRGLMNRFQRQTQATGNKPTPSETRSRESLLRAWSRVEPSVAPFLGEWYMGQDTSYASVLRIYPSRTRGRVCIIHGYFPDGEESSTLSFVTGSVFRDQIRIIGEDLGRSLLVKQGNDLGLFGIYDRGADVFKYSFPRPLEPPTTSSLNNAPEASKIIQQFNAAGCTASLPADSQIATGRSPNTGQSPSRTASEQELVASNLGCTSNLRTILGQSAPGYCTSSEANSGILFEEIKPQTRNADRSIKLEMKVFNRGSADGLVEVYDSNGRIVDVKIIEGNRPPTGLIQSGYDVITRRVPASFFSRYPLGDARKNLKEQKVSVTIPSGGSVKITKSSRFALWYNAAMVAVEVAQIKQGDPGFTEEESVKKIILEFAKEAYLSPNSKAAINIFKSEPTAQAIFSLDFIDPTKLAEILQKLLQYAVTVESDPSKNPLLAAFSDLYQDLGNIGIENALDRYILPGLGTLARTVRIGGSAVNTYARSADLRFAMQSGDKATITLRNATSPSRN